MRLLILRLLLLDCKLGLLLEVGQRLVGWHLVLIPLRCVRRCKHELAFVGPNLNSEYNVDGCVDH